MEEDNFSFSQKYNGFQTKKGNFIWGGAMCLAWAELKHSIIKEDIKLAGASKEAQQMIDNFNAERFHKDSIDPNCVYIKSGYGKKTLDIINKQVEQKFPEKSFEPLNIEMQDDSIIAYAYLMKKLSFLTQFERLPGANLTFNESIQVDGFYAKSKQHRKQIFMINYENKDNFCIALKSKNPKDLLFLVKSQNKLSLQQVFTVCQDKQLKSIDSKDEFMMPVVDFNLKNSIDKLKLPIANKQFSQYKIQEIFENIKLRVDQSGAKVENQAVMVMNRMMVLGPLNIREFILDKSFWLVMKQEGKHPYFAAFITNPIDN